MHVLDITLYFVSLIFVTFSVCLDFDRTR